MTQSENPRRGRLPLTPRTAVAPGDPDRTPFPFPRADWSSLEDGNARRRAHIPPEHDPYASDE